MTQPGKKRANPRATRKSVPADAATAGTPEAAVDSGTATMPSAPSPAWTPFARIPSAVRWGDLDAFNHVNNAAYLVYIQEARLEWLAKVEGPWFDESMMPVVASAHMNYRRQLGWPAAIVVEMATTRVGNSSVTIAHRIVDANDASCVYADGDVVLVWINPSTGRSVPLPEPIRNACGASPA